MTSAEFQINGQWPSTETMRTLYSEPPPVEEALEHFWDPGPEFDTVEVRIDPPTHPLMLLEQLGPSPFERGGFPVIGFLATTYEKVSRYALHRGYRGTSLQGDHYLTAGSRRGLRDGP